MDGFSKGFASLRANFKGAEDKMNTPKTPLWVTASLKDAFSAPLARFDLREDSRDCFREDSKKVS